MEDYFHRDDEKLKIPPSDVVFLVSVSVLLYLFFLFYLVLSSLSLFPFSFSLFSISGSLSFFSTVSIFFSTSFFSVSYFSGSFLFCLRLDSHFPDCFPF